MEYLSQYFDITIDYYNPNIDSKEEYEKRVHEQQRLVDEMNLPIKVIDAGYAPQTFFDMAKGYEQEPEGGKRCYRCYKLRLDQAAKLAQEGGYDYFGLEDEYAGSVFEAGRSYPVYFEKRSDDQADELDYTIARIASPTKLTVTSRKPSSETVTFVKG